MTNTRSFSLEQFALNRQLLIAGRQWFGRPREFKLYKVDMVFPPDRLLTDNHHPKFTPIL